jgi:formate hydrogenlyase maturation protein HycH
MSERVVFYRLDSRFLHQGVEPPADAGQVVYYSLAIGHHVGVIDTFKAMLACPYDRYLAWIGAIGDGEARRKLDGIRRFGEIMIDASHTQLLRPALQTTLPALDAEGEAWARQLDQTLQEIEREPALYLMVRRQP